MDIICKVLRQKKDTEENTVFEELTKDGINRKFDMVVVDSIDRCGRTISCADDVLVKTFVPQEYILQLYRTNLSALEKRKKNYMNI